MNGTHQIGNQMLFRWGVSSPAAMAAQKQPGAAPELSLGLFFPVPPSPTPTPQSFPSGTMLFSSRGLWDTLSEPRLELGSPSEDAPASSPPPMLGVKGGFALNVDDGL